MVQGTMSDAGKSVLCAALCRIFTQDGYRVAPFKSQNMALNSYITRDGLEMGRAQVMQAQAAGEEPDVRMNPILLKPCSDTGSQVIVNGEIRGQMTAADYYKMKQSLVPEVLAAYNGLAETHDIIVIEGAGSPAEINLKEHDIVNMGFAKLVDAPVLLAGDIDRGGVFAQLYGTVALLDEDEAARIKGLVVNKFRGDPEILRPGLAMLEEKAHVPVVGVVPYLHVDLDDEDSMSTRLLQKEAKKVIDVAVIRLPRISNFTDFTPLDAHPALGVRYVERENELGRPDLVILPGTKSTMADLAWMRQNGLEAAIQKLAAAGTPVLGVCGGYQMLGEQLDDPDGVESGGTMRGMGLLPVSTIFRGDKTRTRVTAEVLTGPMKGAILDGYEIHNGKTDGAGEAFCKLENGKLDGRVNGNVFGSYLHGLFDTGELTNALAKFLCERRGIDCEEVGALSYEDYRQQQYDLLADGVRKALDMEAIYACMGLKPGKKCDGKDGSL
jgi:adenosylcobyric acid synthase